MLVRRLSVAFAVCLAGAAFGSACSSSPKNPGHLPPGNGGGSGGTVIHRDSGRDTSTGGADAGDASTEAEASAGSGGTAAAGGSGAGGSGGAVDAGGSGDGGPPAHCSDMQKDGGETDVDCGGPCTPCGTGQACLTGSDCTSLSCDSTLKTCSAPTCSDKIKNGTETDVDCGGTSCNPCKSGKLCLKGTDCDSGVCKGTPLRCQAWNCNDGVKNGTETDVDCGGGSCGKCQRGKACVYNSDCVTNVCEIDPTDHSKSYCACPIGMVTVPVPGAGTFCIDQHEVTYAQYRVFYDTNPLPKTAACAWKSSYTPMGNWPAPVDETTYPVRDVDWCDAYGYCESVGKHLCGKTGGGAGSFGGFTDATESQWYDACSAQGTHTYPYTPGSTFNAGTCNDSSVISTDAGTSAPLATDRVNYTTCQGGEPYLYDMSGNVAEWTDECDTADAGSPQADDCRVRGGSYKETGTDVACTAPRTMRRDANADDVGFRCCLN